MKELVVLGFASRELAEEATERPAGVVVLNHQPRLCRGSMPSRGRYGARLPGRCHEHRPRCRAPRATPATRGSGCGRAVQDPRPEVAAGGRVWTKAPFTPSQVPDDSNGA